MRTLFKQLGYQNIYCQYWEQGLSSVLVQLSSRRIEANFDNKHVRIYCLWPLHTIICLNEGAESLRIQQHQAKTWEKHIVCWILSAEQLSGLAWFRQNRTKNSNKKEETLWFSTLDFLKKYYLRQRHYLVPLPFRSVLLKWSRTCFLDKSLIDY